MSLSILLFLVVFFGFAGGSVLYHPVLGVMGYMFVYLGLAASTWWGATLLEYPFRYSLSIAFCMIAGFFLHRSKLAWMPSESQRREFIIWLFFAVIVSSYALASIHSYDTRFAFTNMLKLGIFLFFFTKIVTDIKHFRWIVKTMCLLGLFLGWNAYNAPEWMFATGRLNYLGSSDYANANTLGNLFSLLLCFAGLQVFQEKTWPMRFLWMLCAAFVANGIILCQSRGVFLALAVTAVVSIWAVPKGSKALKRNIVLGIFLGMGLFLYLTDEHFINRVAAIDEYGEEASSANRLIIWSASLPMLMDYPLGVGIGNFKEYIGNYGSAFRRDAHNTIVRCYGELGIHGLLIFSALYFSAFTQIRRIQKKVFDTALAYEVNLYSFAIFCALLITFIAGLFSTVLYIEFFWWLMVLPICLERSVDLELWKEKNHDKNFT